VKTAAIKSYIHDLIAAGQALIEQQGKAGTNYFQHGQDSYVPLAEFAKWSASCRHLVFMLGTSAEPWRQVLSYEGANTVVLAMQMVGCLESVDEAIDRGLLNRVEHLIAADLFDNLLEQAEYLFNNGYFQAAGVLGRAVLEEHLRKLCETSSCLPARTRPTISDYAQELYKQQHIDKLQLKYIDTMAAIGNAAAHCVGSSDLSKEDVDHLLVHLRRFACGN
jgi:hypothetical protein